LGAVLRPGRRAALRWSRLLAGSARFELYQRPELDIVAYYPVCDPATFSQVSARTEDMVRRGMEDPVDPVFLAAYTVSAAELAARGHLLEADAPRVSLLRSVMMKPEMEDYLDTLWSRVDRLAR
jgi:hypothetical protein